MTSIELARDIASTLSTGQVMHGEAVERAYDCDAYTVHRAHPQCVVFPKTTEEVRRVVLKCIELQIPYTPRGAGTGLSGGAMPASGGVVIALTKMRQILDIDIESRTMRAQAGCPNLSLTKAVQDQGLHFAPDPSSQTVCTLGGNINENSGGPHTLKYGVTADHILSLTMVDTNGEIRTFDRSEALDLLGFIIGSEGTLGIVTEAVVRLTPIPAEIHTLLAAFDTPRQATNTVSAIIAEGIVPAAMEFMDGTILGAVEAAFHTGLPVGAGALLLVELDGTGSAEQVGHVRRIMEDNSAVQIKVAEDKAEREKLWIARKKGIGALGRLAPSIVTHDGVIPRSKLPEVLDFVYKTAQEQGLRVANIFHAGDGNLHPIFLFDDRDPAQVDAAVKAGEAIMRKCIAEGGSVTGEHGIGVEKIDLLGQMFSPEDLRLQEELRAVFNSDNLCNPGKVLPSQKSCVEVRVRRRAAH